MVHFGMLPNAIYLILLCESVFVNVCVNLLDEKSKGWAVDCVVFVYI